VSGQHLCGRLALLVIDQRQELLVGVRLALLEGGQDAGDFGHERHRKDEGRSRITSMTT
jgi:hypothetical protein